MGKLQDLAAQIISWTTEQFNLEPTTKQLPIEGGRRSTPTASGFGSLMGAQLDIVSRELPDQIYRAMEALAKENPDFSLAVDNIVQLGNRPYKIEFDEAVDDATQAELSRLIHRRAKYWYDNAGGINSLRNDLLAQIAITGALSAEIIPRRDLSGIKEVVLVPPRTVVFQYDKEEQTYYPYQDTAKVNGNVAANNPYIELNPLTYKYLAIRRFGDSPYAVPPLLSALRSIMKENNMLDSFDAVLKRFGVLGFLTIAVKAPTPRQGEKDEDYAKRTAKYLNDLRPSVEQGMDNGYVLGFQGQHEFNLAANNANVSGAKDLMDIILKLKHSGLKQDPMMFGQQFNTSETLGRVLLAKTGASIQNYQKLVDEFIAYCISLELQFLGQPVTFVEVTSEPPMIGDKLKEKQAEKLDIENGIALYNQGIIDQQQLAQRVGYDQAAEAEPRTPMAAGNGNIQEDANEPSNSGDASDAGTTDSNRRIVFENYHKFDYSHVHGTLQESLASFRNTKFGRLISFYIEQYVGETDTNYKKAIDLAAQRVAEELLTMSENASEQEVIDRATRVFYTNWEADFTEPQRFIIEKWVPQAYRSFRNDDSILEGLDDLPDMTFNQLDIRALDFFRDSDDFYLGRFVTDADTRGKLFKLIKEEYINNDTPIGRNSGALDGFRAKFGDVLVGEDYKLERIISTTVNNMRNTAALNMMNIAGVQEYEIRGVNDSRQCPYCRGMQGKRFTVGKELGRINTMMSAPVRDLNLSKPFLTSIYRREKGESDAQLTERIRSVDTIEMQNNFVASPPFHPFCRDVVIAIL